MKKNLCILHGRVFVMVSHYNTEASFSIFVKYMHIVSIFEATHCEHQLEETVYMYFPFFDSYSLDKIFCHKQRFVYLQFG